MPLLPSTRPQPSLVHRVAAVVRTRGLIDRGDRIVVAISGGPDSVALLSLLHELASTLDLSLWAAHFNYGLRGVESDGDAAFVVDFCERLRIPSVCEPLTLSGDRYKGRSLQEAARDLRYEALERIRASVGAHKVALGHTRDDQAETLIMRLLRGAGMTGLSGMPCERPPFIRPLLKVSRSEILAYLLEKEIPFREDSSNAKPVYVRNRVRHEVLPLLKQFNPALVDVLARQADILREDDQCLDELAEQQLGQLVKDNEAGECELRRPEFLVLPLALQRRVLRKIVQRCTGQPHGLSFSAVTVIINQVVHGCSGVRLRAGQVWAEREYDTIRVRRTYGQSQTVVGRESIRIAVPSTVQWPMTGQQLRAEMLGSATCDWSSVSLPPTQIVLDADRVTLDLEVRTWLPGDCFYPFGLQGHQKKLQDFFTDRKIPRARRTRIPLVVAPEGIVWIGGYRMDDRFRVTPATTHMVRLTLIGDDGEERL